MWHACPGTTVVTKLKASKTCEFEWVWVQATVLHFIDWGFFCPGFWPQNSNDRTVKLVFRGRLYDSTPSSPDLRLPLPAGPDQLFPPSAAYTRGKPYIKSVFLHNRPCMFFSSLQSAGPSSASLIFPCSWIARGEPTAASLSALCVCDSHSSSTKQQINSVATRRGGWGGVMCSPQQSHFKTVAMETPLSFTPLICVYVAGFDGQIKAHLGKRLF